MAEEDQDGNHAMSIRDLQSMIDITVERLVGFRTQCVISHELTQTEIRNLEAKLIKLFSRQLVIKNTQRDRLGFQSISDNFSHLPRLEQWLQVVGLCDICISHTCSKVKSVEALLEKPQCKLMYLLSNCPQQDEEFRRISISLKNLKRYMDIILKGEEEDNPNIDSTLHWDSFDYHSTLPSYPDGVNQLGGPSASVVYNGVDVDKASFVSTPSTGSSITSPLVSPPITPIHKLKQANHVQKSSSSKSNHCCYSENRPLKQCDTINLLDESISKYKSQESHLPNNVKGVFNSNSFSFICDIDDHTKVKKRSRLPTVPSTDSPPSTSMYSSPSRSPPSVSNFGTLTVSVESSPCRKRDWSSNPFVGSDSSNGNVLPPPPRSPRTPTASVNRVMAHDIAHRFHKHFNFHKKCDYCCNPIRWNTGVKCKECGYKCHRECERKVPPSCGLPKEFVEEFINQLRNHPNASFPLENSPGSVRHVIGTPNLQTNTNGFLKGGGSATPSINSRSSAPSSPDLYIRNPKIPSASVVEGGKFDFLVDRVGQGEEAEPFVQTKSDESFGNVEPIYDKGVNREDSEDSQNWDETDAKKWPRQYSVSMKEWEIPWDELKMGDKLGSGHFGTVYSGYWHGYVAIKVLEMDYLGDEKMLENFKSEVSTFRKTRHDNLVLFMGACMKPPRLAIVTSMVQGMTLYKYIHLQRDKFSLGKITIIGQQIAQGMGYLHAKGIIHKDLRTKNVFMEKERVIITDFGLFSVTKLCCKNRNQNGLVIPPGWLFYLAPEIMRNLKVHVKPEDELLPFSKATDVYAFGTVWYELLCGEWPYMTQDPEAVIWQVGRGMKPSLANLEASQDVKAVLMECWAFIVHHRPDFTSLLKKLDKLPKKKLARSPSHPVHLSRSAESMF